MKSEKKSNTVAYEHMKSLQKYEIQISTKIQIET